MVVDRLLGTLRRVSVWTWLAVAVFLLGSILRLEHALTFDHVKRASDFPAHILGVRWVEEHWAPFYNSPTAHWQVRAYPPLWYFLSALILQVTDNVRWLATMSLVGWVLRHAVLWRILNEAIPDRPWARLSGLTIHAVLPLGVLVDGKVNPEGLHSGIFAVAVYALWRLERQGQTARGFSVMTAIAFGATAALALLAKLTGAILLVVAAPVFTWQWFSRLRRFGHWTLWKGLAVPACAAAVAWCAVGGWWAGTNLVRHGSPFLQVLELDGPQGAPILREPVLYRRPLGWAMPFEWSQYWEFPILRTIADPRPNFWAVEVIGTWSDIYNRGFCRLQGGTITDRVWGGRSGFMNQDSDAWNVNSRCVEWLASMAHVGVWISAAAVLAVFWCAWRHVRTWGARGSLALACVPFVGTAIAMHYALAWPYDHMAILNPRYLLSQVMPMSACLAFALGDLEALAARRTASARLARWVIGLVLGATVLIGAMLIFERFGP
jgi:hypothetical protein